jgi:hypothetical protein
MYPGNADVDDQYSMLRLFAALATHTPPPSAAAAPTPPLSSVLATHAHTPQSLHTVTSEARALLVALVDHRAHAPAQWRPPRHTLGLHRVKDVTEHRDLWMCARHATAAAGLGGERYREVGRDEVDPLQQA